MREATAFWVAAPGRGELRAERLPSPGPGEALVEAIASGVSRGTESLVFKGAVPGAIADAMRCPHQAGAFPGPVKYGYASVGRVVEGPMELVGRRTFCLHPHQDRYVVPASDLRLVPDGVPSARAVLAANTETAVNGLWDGAPRVGDRVAVVGAGVVGALAAYLASRLPGAEVAVIDPDPAKATRLRSLGLTVRADAAGLPPADLVIHASGTAGGLATALDLAGFEATVLELSWYGAGPVSAPLGVGFHPKRLRLVSSQVGHVAAARRARWDHARRADLALRLLADPALDALLEPSAAFAELPAVMAGVAGGPNVMCQVILYEQLAEKQRCLPSGYGTTS